MESLCENTGTTSEKNPLLINTVIRCLLRFFPLWDLKRYRLVCHEWNSAATTLMIKQAKIVFRCLFRPGNYMEYLSTSLFPFIPFTSFQFSSNSRHHGWNVAELWDFLTWAENIKRLEIKSAFIFNDAVCLNTYDMNSLIGLVVSTLVELKIEKCETHFAVSLNKLSRIRILSLSKCELIVNTNERRTSPLKITLQNVTFSNENGNKLENVVINDFVDFSGCSQIEIFSSGTFDLSRDVLNAIEINFSSVRLINWRNNYGKTEHLKMSCCPFQERTPMEIKQLNFGRSKIDLSLLPTTIEKLSLFRNTYLPTESIQLPNLKFLSVSPDICERESTFQTHSLISNFANNLDLVIVELHGGIWEGYSCLLNLNWLPKCVQKLKLVRPKAFSFVEADEEFNVNVLILEHISCAMLETISKNIKAKILVLSVVWKDDESTDELISFVLKNNHSEKIVVQMHQGLSNSKPFEQTKLFTCVDINSTHYEFTNKFGKSITKEEYRKYSDVNQEDVFT